MAGLEEFAELFGRQPRVSRDVRHCEGVYRVVARDCESDSPIGHDGVFAFAGDPESNFTKYAHRVGMTDAGQFGHFKRRLEPLARFSIRSRQLPLRAIRELRP